MTIPRMVRDKRTGVEYEASQVETMRDGHVRFDPDGSVTINLDHWPYILNIPSGQFEWVR